LPIVLRGSFPVLLHGGLACREFLLELDALISAFAGEFFRRIGQLVLVQAELGLGNLQIAGIGDCTRWFRVRACA
jgi:hypothetical protein